MGSEFKGASNIVSTATPPEPPVGAPTRRSESGKGAALMLLGMFLFAAVDTGAKFLTEGLHPIQITWTRQLGLLAGAIFLIAYHGRTILRTSHPRLQVLRGGMAVGVGDAIHRRCRLCAVGGCCGGDLRRPFHCDDTGGFDPAGTRRLAALDCGIPWVRGNTDRHSAGDGCHSSGGLSGADCGDILCVPTDYLAGVGGYGQDGDDGGLHGDCRECFADAALALGLGHAGPRAVDDPIGDRIAGRGGGGLRDQGVGGCHGGGGRADPLQHDGLGHVLRVHGLWPVA